MKKLVFSLVVFAAMCLTSCGNKATSSEVTSDSTAVDSTQVVDSIACDSTMTVTDSIK